MKNWFSKSSDKITRQPSGGNVITRQFQSYTLRRKLTILFLIASIVPLGILAFINYLNSRTILVNNANDGLSAAASLTANQLDGYFTQKINTVQSEAQIPNVVNYLTLSANGSAESQDDANVQEFIRALASQDPNYIRSISIMNVSGNVLVDTNSINVGSNRSNMDYFQEVMKTGLTYLSTLEFDQQTGASFIYFASPVRDASGKIIGVLSKQYTDSVLRASIARNMGLAGIDSYPIVLDRNHLRLADGSDQSLIYKTLVPLDSKIAAELQASQLLPPGPLDDLSANLPDFESKLNQLENQSFFATELHGVDAHIEQVATANMTTQPWVVIFAQSQEVFLKPIAMQARNNVLVMILLSLAVIVFGFFVSQTVAGPIVRLTETAEAIHNGNLDVSAVVESQDEIGKLSLAFNDMTFELRSFIDSLEQRVAERTTVAENARTESESARKDIEVQMWLATGQTQLADVMRGEQTLSQLAENVISQICQYTGAQAGALFLLKEKTLILVGRYAYVDRPGFEGSFQLGEGLVGQAAADGKVITLDAIPSDTLVISTGLADIKPHQLAAAPFYMNGKVVGVLELATLSTFTQTHLELWERISESIGSGFHTVQTRRRFSELLMESQQQSEELQAQEEELRAQAENLKVTREIKARKDEA